MKFSFNKKIFRLLSVAGVLFGGTSVNAEFIKAESNGIPGTYIVQMPCGDADRTGATPFSEATVESAIAGTSAVCTHYYKHTICGCSMQASEEDAKEISTRVGVEMVAQDQEVSINDATWGIDRIDQVNLPLDGEYEPFGDGEGVNAYVIDTGVYVDHNEFEDRAEWGHNSADNDDRDCNGHGTHVAGTVGGKEYGVAKKVHIIGVKVLTCAGSGSYTGVIAGVDWAAADAKDRGRPATANLSLGGGKYQPMNDAVKRLHESGVVTVIAAGNSNRDAKDYSPASEPTVLTVGATSSSDGRASFSNWGTLIDVFAPGQSITAAWIGSPTSTRTISGTSMAAPHVCGAAALYLGTGMNPQDVDQYIIDGATPDKVTSPGTGSPNRLLYLKPSSTTNAPTPSDGGPPTPGNPLSWDITMKQATPGSSADGKPMINVLYQSSKRGYGINVFQEDCETPTDVFSRKIERKDSEKPKYMDVTVALTIDDQEALEKSPIWDEDKKSFSFCMSKVLITPDEMVVTERKTIFKVSVDNQAGFDISGIVVEADEIEEEELSMSYKGSVEAFQCDKDSWSPDEDKVLGPFDTLNVCVKVIQSEEPGVVVSGFNKLTITQDGTGVTFLAIENGETDENWQDLVETTCNADGVCMARVQLINAFYANTSEQLNVDGIAILGGNSRKLSLPVKTSSSLRGGKRQERKLDEDDEPEFGLTVKLAEPCKEGEGGFLRKILG